MNKYKPLIIAALAITFTVGVGSTAFAWNGIDFDHHSPSHRVMEHAPATAPNIKEGPALAFNQHGGGHEKAVNNEAIHKEELGKNPQHRDVDPQVPGASFEQHGGGHELAPNNSDIHEREKNDPKHRD